MPNQADTPTNGKGDDDVSQPDFRKEQRRKPAVNKLSSRVDELIQWLAEVPEEATEHLLELVRLKRQERMARQLLAEALEKAGHSRS